MVIIEFIYKHEDSGVVILTVRHGKQILPIEEVTVQPPPWFAVPGIWIPYVPAGMTRWGLNGYLRRSKHNNEKTNFNGGKKYTFSDYFELNNPTEEIVGELGYSFSHEVVNLPQSDDYDHNDVRKLRDTFYAILPRITVTSDIAKRDFLIAPILVELARNTESKINVEYAIEIDSRLSGSLDYLIRLKQVLIVIEAKKGDLDKGFNQLAAELIALDKYEQSNGNDRLYGAVTIGDVWRFGVLDRKRQRIHKDIDSFTIPGDLERVFSILIGILMA